MKGHQQVKHINIWHHYIHEHVKEGQIALKYVASMDNIADVLTKSLTCMLHINNVKGLFGLTN